MPKGPTPSSGPARDKRDLGSEAETLATDFAAAIEERLDAFLEETLPGRSASA